MAGQTKMKQTIPVSHGDGKPSNEIIDISKPIKVKRKLVPYSTEVVDKICLKLSTGMSFKQIAAIKDKFPSEPTMYRWSVNDAYAKIKFIEARSENLEQRKLDEIINLKALNLKLEAKICSSMVLDGEISNAMSTVLFKAMVDDNKYKIELAYKDLAILKPDVYGKITNTNMNVNEVNKTKAAPELAKDIGMMIHTLLERKDVLMISPDIVSKLKLIVNQPIDEVK